MRRKYLSVFIFLFFIASNILFAQTQTITSAIYNSATGVLILTATNLDDTAQLIDASRLTISDGTYSRSLLITADVDPSSQTTAVLIVTGDDKLYLNAVLDANGTFSSRGGTYNIAASNNWNGPLSTPDLTGNPITVSNYLPPSITSATYDAGTGEMVVTGSRLAKYTGFDIDANMFTITGYATGTYTLTSGTSDVDIDSETSFTLNITGTDKTEVGELIDDNGTSSSDAVTYNIAGADGWNQVVNATHTDLTGNGITASNVNYAPSASDLRYAGTNAMGSDIIARFTYSDPETDSPGSHIFEWFRSPIGTGPGTSIQGPNTDSTYTITAADTGQYIRFEATPVAATGRTPGETESSAWEEVNLAPKASNLRYAGSNGLDSIFIARFTYTDNEGDSPGAHLFRWYRSPNGVSGWTYATNYTTDSAYTIVAADTGNYLRFSVIPVALTGTTPGVVRYSTPLEVNTAPRALNLHFVGSNGLDSTLIARFTYSDNDSDNPGAHLFRWYSSPNGVSGWDPITGFITDSTYTIVPADTGSYLMFSVTPHALTGTTPGALKYSSAFGVNMAPKALNLRYAGSNGLDSTLIARFTYSDNEDDSPGAHSFIWYRSPNGVSGWGPISGPSTDSTYLVAPNDTGSYLMFSVKPHALTGTTPGALKYSSSLKINMAPKASDLDYAGSNGLDSTITATFVYSDEDDDPAGDSIFRWFRSPDGTGLGTPITGQRTHPNYVIQDDDTGQYISFQVQPTALTGTTPGFIRRSAWLKVNVAPRAGYLDYSGSNGLDSTLIAAFTYYDADDDLPGDHLFEWFRSPTGTGNGISIQGPSTDSTYTITVGDTGQYLRFKATPVALTGTTPGFTRQSEWLKVNTAPKVSNLDYSGWNGLDSTITASFTFTDEEDDIPGDHIYTWYFSNTGTGSGTSVKGPSADSTYTISPSDLGNYLSYVVIPYALTGTTPGNEVRSPWFPINTRPEASDLSVTGGLNIGDSLELGFDYFDAEDDAEGEHKYQWYINNLPIWSGATAIANDTLAKHYIKRNDATKYLGCIVTPVALTGTVEGQPEPSAFVGPVNSLPVATNPVMIAPSILVGDTLTADFDYFDLDGDLPGDHIYEWYRSNSSDGTGASLILGETDSFYVALPQDNNKWIAYEIKPVALTGSSPGDSVMSPWTGPIGENIPSATISGGDSICPDDVVEAQININIAGGTPPFEITYNDGTKDTVISDLEEREYIFTTKKAGEYTLVNVADRHYDTGIVSPDIVVVYVYNEVRAVLTGSAEICDDSVSVAPLQVDFTGFAPWTFELGITPGPDTIYTNITQNPFTFDVRYAARYRIKSLSDSQCPGDTVGSGTATVSFKESPDAVISGTDTVCPGDTAYLTVTLTSGYEPWSFTYTVNNVNPTIISGITDTEYTLKVLDEGIYKLIGVEDIMCTGQTSGIGKVVYRSVPTATLSGGGLMCEGTTTDLIVALTGTAPWDFKYRLTNDYIIDTVPVTDIMNSPGIVNIHPDTLTYYTLTEVTDKYCPGTVSGNATVSVIPAPEVELIGLKPAYNIETFWVPIFGSPEGGEFGGSDALIEKDDTTFFLPIFAGLTHGNPHKITYGWQEQSTSCWGWDTALVEVIEADAEINFPDNNKFYCYNDSAFIITGANIASDTGTFTISGGIGLVDNGDNSATINPSVLESGTYTVTYTYFDEIPVPITDEFEVQEVPEIWFVGFYKHIFCNNDEPIELNGNVSEGTFYGNSVSGNPAAGYYFVPEIAKPGVDTIFFTYETPQGCIRTVFDTTFIYESPIIAFEVDDVCIALGEGDSTAFINNTTSSDPVVLWEWNFGDVNSGEENTSNLMNPTHIYTNSGSRQVTLRATTENECTAEQDSIFNFGDNPVIDFSWESECFLDGIPVNFNDNSSCNEGSIKNYQWTFYHNQGQAQSYEQNPGFTYSEYGDYDVELTAVSEYGCENTLIKVLHLRPTFKLTEQEYYEDFNDGASSWVTDYVDDETYSTNSWVYGSPGSPFNGGTPVTKVWYTNIKASSPKEKSWVTSPCFDFRGTKRPMIKLDIWRAFDETRDGAVLQYTYDNGNNWTTLGEIEDGINWYNRYNILGQPGDDHIGWSDITDIDWIESRHKLDELRAKTNVQFRIAYGSNGSAIGNEGIAFDNISIEEREKIVLIEHFTNYADSACSASDSILNNIVNNCMDAVDLHFHIPYPGEDPFYDHSKNAVDSRKLYYGMQVYDIPYSIMDGGYDYDHLFSYQTENNTITATDVGIESLADPEFNIGLNTVNTGSSITVDVTLTALRDQNNKSLRLHIVVLEREITQVTPEGGEEIYESIVKAMLPGVAGTSFIQDWTQGQEEEVSYSWTIENVFDAEEIRVVAFIQDDNTLEVYQAAIDSMDYISSIDKDIAIKQDMKIIIFPNPAYGTTYLKFNQPVYNECELKMYNNMGALVYSLKIAKGSELISFNTGNLHEGLYIIRIESNKSVIDTRKLIISQ